MALCVTLCLLIKLEGRGDVEVDLKLYLICVAEIIIFCFYVLKDVRLHKPTNPRDSFIGRSFFPLFYLYICTNI